MRHSNCRRQRSAFTLVEIMVVSFLMAFLATLLGVVWSGFGRPLTDAITRAQIAQEVHLAVAALARDFGGNLAGPDGRLGFMSNGKLVGRMDADGSMLRLCFDGGAVADGLAEWADPDIVISYLVQDGNLVRWNEFSGSTFVVARGVQQLAVTELDHGVQLQITFVARNLTRTYTLIGLEP